MKLFALLLLAACIDFVDPPRVPHARLSVVAQVSPAIIDTLVVEHFFGETLRVVSGETKCMGIELGKYLVEQFFVSEDTEFGRLFPPTRYVWAQRDGLNHTVWFFGVGSGIISTDSVAFGALC